MDPVEQWQQLRGPISFLLGTIIVLTELVRWVFGGPVEPQLLVLGAGLCGLPAFLPQKSA